MEIVNNIEASFYPTIYPESLNTDRGLPLLLFRKTGLARYVMVVENFDSSLSVKTQIENIRKTIRHKTSALWLLKEVGAYIVFVCDDISDFTESKLVIDKTGFHAVIVQGVHMISKSGEHLFNHSKWLNKSFGGTETIAARLMKSAI